MLSIPDFIEHVHQYLIRHTDGQQPRQEVYNHFINECKSLQLSEEAFYKEVLKPAAKSIDWDAVERDKQAAEEAKKRELESAAKKAAQQTVLQLIYGQVKTALDSGVLAAENLQQIFQRAVNSEQDIYQLAEYIEAQIDKYGFKPYPAPTDSGLIDAKERLLSTNWYNSWHYNRIAVQQPATPTPPPPKPEPTPKSQAQPAKAKPAKPTSPGKHTGKIILTVLLLVGAAIFYLFWWLPYSSEKDVQRMYNFSTGLVLRSSPSAATNYNILQSLEYGAELKLYEKTGNWAEVKINETKGYVHADYLLDKKSFFELNSIFADTITRNIISKAKYRRALLYYFRRQNIMGNMDAALQKEVYGDKPPQKEIWQVKAREKPIKPNTIAYPSIKDTVGGLQPKGFAFLVTQLSTQKRKLVVYAFTDADEPQFVYEEDAPDEGYITAISPNYFGEKPYVVRYTSK